jgi:hypothetical protein
VPISVLPFPFAKLHALYLENICCKISFRKHGVNLAPLGSPGTSVIPVIGPIPEALYLLVPAMTFAVTPLMSYTYVYIPVSHVYKLACTLHRIINLLPLVCCTPTSDTWGAQAVDKEQVAKGLIDHSTPTRHVKLPCPYVERAKETTPQAL